MEVSRIIAEIDAQILKLQQARALAGRNYRVRTTRGPGPAQREQERCSAAATDSRANAS